MIRPPSVFIIGTGPGDPGLLTIRGLELLRRADVVVHDALVPPGVLQLAQPDAERISVGTAAPAAMELAAIGYLIADKAREGKLVARLKWGDPFVFDRGGEEALFLHEQGVPFEIVPGLPAGIATPAYAGIPVTYPGGGNTLTLVRGFEGESRDLPEVDWASLSRLDGTVVCYAGAQQLTRLFDSLQRHGWPQEETAAIIYGGTTTNQETVEGTIAELTTHVHEHPRRAPGVLVLGRVVGFRNYLKWFDSRPLFGKRVLVTRPMEGADELADRLAALGAQAIKTPMIRIVPPDDPGPLQRAVGSAADFDWIVFSSGNAVDAFMRIALRGSRDVRSLAGPKICAVGAATAARLARYGVKADLVPGEFHADALVDAILQQGPVQDARVLFPRADIGREVIPERLRAAGALVTEVTAYRTQINEAARDDDRADVYRMLLDRQLDAVTFTSGSAVTAFASIFGEDQAADLLARTVVACIGPTTAAAVRRLGVPVAVQPATHTTAALVDALAAHFTSQTAAATGI